MKESPDMKCNICDCDLYKSGKKAIPFHLWIWAYILCENCRDTVKSAIDDLIAQQKTATI